MPDANDSKNTDTTDTSGTDTGAGGAGTDTGSDGSGDGTDTTDGTELGDAGKELLAKLRKEAKDAERRAAAAERKAAELERAGLSEQDRKVAEAREEARREALGEVNARLVAAEVRARAAGKLANPELAAKLLDLSTFTPDDGGDIDGDAITAAIDELVKAEPYLAASPATGGGSGGQGSTSAGTNGKPGGNIAGGARGDTPTTFSRSQLRDPAFYEANKAAILKAASEGRITND